MLALIDWIQQGPLWRMHAFFRALCLNCQEHVIDKTLELNPDDYISAADKAKIKALQLVKKVKKNRGICGKLTQCAMCIAGGKIVLTYFSAKI